MKSSYAVLALVLAAVVVLAMFGVNIGPVFGAPVKSAVEVRNV